MPSIDRTQKVIIAGAGAFGLSTAYHLLQRGWKRVIIYDQSSTLPAPDAASTDLNKVVRSSYTDATYTRLTREALQSWRDKSIWGDAYHESGVLIRGEEDSYTGVSLQNDRDHGVRVKEYRHNDNLKEDIQVLFGETVQLGSSIINFDGYLNLDSGWAHAQQAIELLLEHVRQLGGEIEPNKRVSELSEDGKGVKFQDGTEDKADIVIIATGSWTPSTFPNFGVTNRILATGQCIAKIQLTEDEAKVYANVPVVLDYASDTNIVKFAIHCSGYTYMKQNGLHLISTPRTFMTDEDGGAIPRSMLKELRERLREIYPELAARPFSGTRLCWYADTPDFNWVIDFHPEYPSVVFATGGSGHAFKFLPILGRLVADRIENTLEPSLMEKFSFNRIVKPGYGSDQNRAVTGTTELDLSELCVAEDLLSWKKVCSSPSFMNVAMITFRRLLIQKRNTSCMRPPPELPHEVGAIRLLNHMTIKIGLYSVPHRAEREEICSRAMLQESYDKFKPSAFRFPELNGWHIVITSETMIDELRKSPDEALSFSRSASDIIAGDYTLGPNVERNPYHVGIVRTQLTKNLPIVFPDVLEEAVFAIDELIPLTDDWTPVKAFNTVKTLVCRVSNRTFVGLPLCREPEFIDLNVRFTIDVVLTAKIINLFPDFLKPIVGRSLSRVRRGIQIGLKHLTPIIEERQKKIDEYGRDYPGKPNDALSWLMDEAKDEERSTYNLAMRVLTLNFAAIHTTSMTFTQALFDLACRPEYIPLLRSEIENIIKIYGWNKVSIGRMHKLDSFFKESQRIHGLGALSLPRKAIKDYTLSDGTFIPEGSNVSAICTARQCDDAVYSLGKTFDGFRFLDPLSTANLKDSGRERSDDIMNMSSSMVSTGLNYLPFGHGRHACPGRFFVSMEMKIIMAHILLTYDFKLMDGCVRDQTLEKEKQWQWLLNMAKLALVKPGLPPSLDTRFGAPCTTLFHTLSFED
ncbi:hypothetical protein Clacol_002324 [Clathrus columnatus]|uniref:FAD dependent oxidoreductase domain-containing protein n=1 Tax=Clathrus columnatus TaxID=1419009 RepID=A0AAV5A0E2_9AGAM|nr:hypothetical protein Clacol_002324 [Clathrus columnatus]